MTKDIRSVVGAIDLTKQFAELRKFLVPTGIIAFDKVLGGGIPAGKLTELYGDYSTGKSRIAGHILAQTQSLGGLAVYLDNERALDSGLVELTGIDPATLVYPDPDRMLGSIEDVFKIITDIMTTWRADHTDELMTIVWDSVAATPGVEDLENELGMATAAMRRAKVISDGLKKIMAEVYRTKTCLVFINQIRDKIGVMYGEKVDTVGGKAIKFTASVRAHVHLAGKIKDEKTEEQIGSKGRLVVEKCKVGKPFGVVNFEMLTDCPIDKYAGLLDYMVRHEEIVDEGRGWYRFPNGKKNFRADKFPELYEKRAGNEDTGD